MAKSLTATFGTTVVEIRINQEVHVDHLHPTNVHPFVATAFIGAAQLIENGSPVEHVASKEEQAEALMLRDLETRYGPKV